MAYQIIRIEIRFYGRYLNLNFIVILKSLTSLMMTTGSIHAVAPVLTSYTVQTNWTNCKMFKQIN